MPAAVLLLVAIGSIAKADTAIEGNWRIDDQGTLLQLEPCRTKNAKTYCGRITWLGVDRGARDFANKDIWQWGRRLCGAEILSNLRPDPTGGWRGGRLYDPESGDIYHVTVNTRPDGALDVYAYYGASSDEAVDLAIAAVRGELSVMDAASFVTRAAIGKSDLGDTLVWARTEAPPQSCRTAK